MLNEEVRIRRIFESRIFREYVTFLGSRLLFLEASWFSHLASESTWYLVLSTLYIILRTSYNFSVLPAYWRKAIGQASTSVEWLCDCIVT
jgi:hypothetical protein